MKKWFDLILATIAGVALIAGIWVGAYAYIVSSEIQISSPANGIYISEKAPKIKASWNDFLVTPKIAVKVNGQSIKSGFKAGFIEFRMPYQLDDGENKVEIDLEYPFPLPLKKKIAWNFIVDSIPPEVEFEGSAGFLVANKEVASFKGKTESDVLLGVSLNGKRLSDFRSAKSGDFPVTLKGLSPTNKLMITALDKAGNKKVSEMDVLVDKEPPRIVELLPLENETLVPTDDGIVAKLEEVGSGIKKINMMINRKPVTVTYDKSTGTVNYPISNLTKGTYKLGLEIVDYAGWKDKREIAFNVENTFIKVKRGSRTLDFYRDGKLVKTYRVAIGTPGFPTPRGRFHITQKRRNPVWINPNEDWSKDMPPSIGSGYGNPLGTRALNLSIGAIRIHGTYKAGSIGTAASHGCIRMHLRDIEELFEMVSVGTPVHISDW